MEVRHTPRKSADVVLHALLAAYARPAFGSLSKTELDCLMLEAMQDAGMVSGRPTQHELMTMLRLPRARARNLLLRLELRTLQLEDLDLQLRRLLIQPRVLKDGALYALEVDSPYLLEHVRERVSHLGDAARTMPGTDFVQLSEGTLIRLIELMMPAYAREAAVAELVRQGVADPSVRVYVELAVRTLGPPLVNAGAAAAVNSAWLNLANLLVPG